MKRVIGNLAKRMVQPGALRKMPKGTLIQKDNVTYTLKNTLYLPKRDLETTKISIPNNPPFYANYKATWSAVIHGFGNLANSYNKVKVFVSQCKEGFGALSSITVGVIVLQNHTGDLIDIEILKQLLGQTDLNQTVNILYNSLENQVAEYIKAMNLEIVRILLPNNVSPLELRNGPYVDDISPFSPVLDGLYVDLINDYPMADINQPDLDTTDLSTPQNRSMGYKIGSFLGFCIICMLSLALQHPMPMSLQWI